MSSEQDKLRQRGSQTSENSTQNGTNSSPNPNNREPTSTGERWDGSFGNPGGGGSGNTPPYPGSDNTVGAPSPPTPGTGPTPTAHEHALAVQQWMWQCQLWHSMNWAYMTSFPMYAASAMNFQMMQQQAIGGAAANTVNGGVAATNTGPAQLADTNLPNGAPQAADGADANNVAAIGLRFRIPSLWKRVAAEFIDFFVLFLIKLVVTILTVEYVGIVDIHKYDLDLLLSQNIDYNTAFAMTSELIAMEIINRIFICIFETLCLRRGVAGTIGGTTPGKSIMGLRVVSCEQIYDGPAPRMIRVLPAGDIGLWNALVRSVIKNFSLAFFFPVCFTVFFFQHNRAAYDIISNCIVVEAS